MDAQGLSTIVFTLLRYKGSTKLVEHGLLFLNELTYFLKTEQVGDTLAALNFIDKISEFATSTTTFRASQNAATLLYNLSSCQPRSLETKIKLATNANFKFMMNLMTSYPYNLDVTHRVCGYFANVIAFPEAKERMLEHGVIEPLAAAFRRFRTRNGGTEKEKTLVASIMKDCKKLLARLIE